ncbi:GH25 family lysozyme [Paenibacillus sp. IITD108]|uniref:GH25 family lysozyme n=1 Tax=Paenibacillus sp. IITD108 TaxID=3116649 RepID=UPI002F3F70C2
MKKIRNIIVIALLVIITLAFLEYKGIIWHNSFFAKKYEVKGLDVSHYQGDINWSEVVKENEYQFVFIKATEGNDFIDKKFDYNWKEAKKQGILTGAYHFFSMRSSAEKQAENFINIVPNETDSLPPVIDIEIHLKHDPKKVRDEIQTLAHLLENYYEKKPILYVTYSTYNTYIKDEFIDFDIWIRDIIKFPTLGERKWIFWQYNNRGRIDGINMYVDINVFNGNIEELNKKFR